MNFTGSIAQMKSVIGEICSVLDEATSSVAPENESLLMGAIEELTRN